MKNCSAGVGEHFEEQLKAVESLQRGRSDKPNDLDVQGGLQCPRKAVDADRLTPAEHVDKRVNKIVKDVNSVSGL